MITDANMITFEARDRLYGRLLNDVNTVTVNDGFINLVFYINVEF